MTAPIERNRWNWVEGDGIKGGARHFVTRHCRSTYDWVSAKGFLDPVYGRETAVADATR